MELRHVNPAGEKRDVLVVCGAVGAEQRRFFGLQLVCGVNLFRLNGGRQPLRDSRQLAGLGTSSRFNTGLFVSSFFKRHRRVCIVRPVCLPTQEGRWLNGQLVAGRSGSACSVPSAGGSQQVAASAYSWLFLERVCRARLCLQGKVFFLSPIVQPSGVCVVRLWKCDMTVLLFPSLCSNIGAFSF